MADIYLDNHTTTPLHPKVIEKMRPFFEKKWGHYLQPHKKGQELFEDIKKAYEKVYEILGADVLEDTLIFTASNEEAISQVFHIVYENATRGLGKNQFVTLSFEDAPILMGLKKLEQVGCSISFLEINASGFIEIDKIVESITPRTALISVSLASGISGLVQPIEALSEICQLRGIFLHLDISYTLGKIECSVNELGADFITFGGDKIQGPKSSGILYVRPGIKISPLISGGLEQGGFRGGPLDTAALIGLATACELAYDNLNEMCLETASLRDLFERLIDEGLKHIKILFEHQMRLPNMCVISFEGVKADALLYNLDQRGVYATIGGTHFQKLETVLTKLGIMQRHADTALSFALSVSTTHQEVVEAAQIIIEEVKKIRLITKNVGGIHESC